MRVHEFRPDSKHPYRCRVTGCGLDHKHSIHNMTPQTVQDQVAEEGMEPYTKAQPGLPIRPERMVIVDIAGPEVVEVQVSTNPIDDSDTIWVNVDGVCRLRICRPKHSVVINDERKKL